MSYMRSCDCAEVAQASLLASERMSCACGCFAMTKQSRHCVSLFVAYQLRSLVDIVSLVAKEPKLSQGPMLLRKDMRARGGQCDLTVGYDAALWAAKSGNAQKQKPWFDVLICRLQDASENYSRNRLTLDERIRALSSKLRSDGCGEVGESLQERSGRLGRETKVQAYANPSRSRSMNCVFVYRSDLIAKSLAERHSLASLVLDKLAKDLWRSRSPKSCLRATHGLRTEQWRRHPVFCLVRRLFPSSCIIRSHG